VTHSTVNYITRTLRFPSIITYTTNIHGFNHTLLPVELSRFIIQHNNFEVKITKFYCYINELYFRNFLQSVKRNTWRLVLRRVKMLRNFWKSFWRNTILRIMQADITTNIHGFNHTLLPVELSRFIIQHNNLIFYNIVLLITDYN
jgi:hypothetical protein